MLEIALNLTLYTQKNVHKVSAFQTKKKNAKETLSQFTICCR